MSREDELLERFERFFAAVNDGASPYPWQRALVLRVARDGRWPAAIAAPTGAGKSSVVDVHVFLVAERRRQCASGQAPSVARPPRRMVLVAPRRVLVDDQYERACRLAALLADPAGRPPIVAEVTAALGELSTTAGDDAADGPLGVAQLRGGMLLDSGWRMDGSRCQVICATPQMWGSRLLLRGYRASRLSRNLEAGLLGHDAVAIVDEAHLHERLVETASRIAGAPAPLALQVVAMSATRADPDAHTLTPDDLRDPALRRRVCARKRLEVVIVERWPGDAARRIAEIAEAQEAHGRTVGVFVNTVAMALDVAGRLTDEVALVCGRMRPADVAALRARHPGLLDATGNTDVRFLVSTQSLEVGVDLDLGAIVTAVAPASALAQRAGRLNRSGGLADTTLTVVSPADPDAAVPPYDAAEIVAADAWLEALDGDVSPERVAATPLPDPPAPALPALSDQDLATLALTSRRQSADPDVSLYVDEPRDREDRRVAVGARAHLPTGPSPLSAFAVADALRTAPPRPHELAQMPIGRELDALLAASPGAWVLRSDGGERTAAPVDERYRARDGDVLVVPAGSPVCVRGVIGRARRAGEPLDDVMAERLDGPPDEVLELSTDAVADALAADPSLSSREARKALAAVLAGAGMTTAATRLRRARLRDLEVVWCGDPQADASGLLVLRDATGGGRVPAAGLAGDGLPVTVDDHAAAVEERMAAALSALEADALEIAPERLLAAARLHDDGKRHPRFQLRMGAEPDGQALAKPAAGRPADRGDGWRHEQLSAAYAWARTGGDAVVTALVAGHHGHGRLLFDRDAAALLQDWEACPPDAAEAVRTLFGPGGDYERLRDRVQRELGVHRLAHLEALLRCADMQISREGR